jgi:hypothetical protein
MESSEKGVNIKSSQSLELKGQRYLRERTPLQKMQLMEALAS